MPITYKCALEIIKNSIKPLHVTQELPLFETLRSIASQNILARYALPKTSISLKEGYGIHLLKNEMRYTLLCDKVIDFLPEGYACKLATGDSIPVGVDAVIAEEDIRAMSEDTIWLSFPPQHGQNIKREGEDIKLGEIILNKGECISAHKITPIASQGISKICIFRKPKVSILSIGNHLSSIESPNQHDTIYNSNAMSLGARIIELNAEIGTIEVCAEDEKIILKKLEILSKNADFVITSGAMSSQDAMNVSLENALLNILFHRVCISPSRPSSLSLLGNTPILHLPGLPLSCMLGFEMLGVPILKTLQNLSLDVKPTMLKNQKKLTCRASCTSAIPGWSDGKVFMSTPTYQAGMLNVLRACNGYLLIEGKESIEEGELVPFYAF